MSLSTSLPQLHVQPFRFMDMPPELREMVYEYLVEDPYYPPPSTEATLSSPLLNWLMPSWPLQPAPEKKPKKGSWIFLASKQIYAEYIDVGCKKSTFHLSVSPANYPKSIPITTTPTASSTAVTSSPPGPIPAAQNLWTIAPDTLKQIRKCDIKLVITSPMLGVSDPRSMVPDSWALAHQVRAELRHVSKVQELNLHVKAIGDPLWNPLWVWYHATQSFKNMGTAPAPSAIPLLSPTFAPTSHPSTHSHSRSRSCSSRSCTPEKHHVDDPVGPKLNRITFSLDTWSPGENHLERDPSNQNEWAWFCTQGHCIGSDGGVDMPVREFCAKLYKECRACRPADWDDESEDDEA
ncbi:hypothetical protein K504DRAFT_469898 [Pleomassaria siparia CBS 279.74]|uniref:Uncharacterized protein n=1 Tax=Pleomassaria siparia CBS 279.74 TaxID=1314801 RepID=A0A6G1KSK4_9PLEO|nr:hypothetical protein K504DRAFT_469898 [Pleomassaria siparia CBS 279.74]